MRAVPAAGRARILFLGVVAFLWLGAILARLIDLQVVRHGELAQRAQRQQQRTLEVTPKRGVIYDRNRHELAVSISVDSVFAVPSEVIDPEATARRLSPVLGVDTTILEDKLRSSRSFVWLKRKLTAAEADRVRSLGLAGVYFQPEHKRFYPKRELAAHVLGFVGMDENGLAGVELGLDNVIRGRSRRLVITADGRRRWFDRVGDVPTEGASVILTLDENVQYIAERELAAAIAKTRAASGTIIVQEPRSGEILALANYPTFNPNNPSAVPQENHVNRALSFVYEPGSTFKLVTIAAALEEGAADPEEVIDCQQGAIYIVGHRIRDHKPFGLLTLRQVVYESSDVGAIKVGLRLGNDKMYQHIRRWRFGQPTGIELPAESPGLVRPPSNWSRISIGAVSMGQEVAITSLQLTAAVSAVANGGVWVQPHVVREIYRGNQAEPIPPKPQERIIDSKVAEELRRMLAGVVREGTGRAAQPVGYSAAGKTGTAQKIDKSGRYSPTDFVASFTGFAPLDDPVVTVTVVLDSPRGLYHGGEVAAPVFRSVVERVLAYRNIPRDLPVRAPAPLPRLERAAITDFAPGQFDPAPGMSEAGVFAGDLSDWRNYVKTVPTAPVSAATKLSPSLPPPRPTGPPARLPDIQPTGEPGGHPPSTIVVVSEAETVAVPDLIGRPLRVVGEECSKLGLEAMLVGSGVAVVQRPEPGMRVPRGSRVWVQFQPVLPRAPERRM
ncbi:MAG TPA: penicillin-binding protein [Candidatus Xenobia bacterium]|nr:penicillin-binding protein [Candidatus Xenobia bacterium]